MSERKVNRDEARKFFEEKGLDYSILGEVNKDILVRCLNKRMKDSGCYNGDYEVSEVNQDVRDGNTLYYLWCRSSNWDRRECISFNDGGFIGFAGWADKSNVKPILEGFIDWVILISVR